MLPRLLRILWVLAAIPAFGQNGTNANSCVEIRNTTAYTPRNAGLQLYNKCSGVVRVNVCQKVRSTGKWLCTLQDHLSSWVDSTVAHSSGPVGNTLYYRKADGTPRLAFQACFDAQFRNGKCSLEFDPEDFVTPKGDQIKAGMNSSSRPDEEGSPVRQSGGNNVASVQQPPTNPISGSVWQCSEKRTWDELVRTYKLLPDGMFSYGEGSDQDRYGPIKEWTMTGNTLEIDLPGFTDNGGECQTSGACHGWTKIKVTVDGASASGTSRFDAGQPGIVESPIICNRIEGGATGKRWLLKNRYSRPLNFQLRDGEATATGSNCSTNRLIAGWWLQPNETYIASCLGHDGFCIRFKLDSDDNYGQWIGLACRGSDYTWKQTNNIREWDFGAPQ